MANPTPSRTIAPPDAGCDEMQRAYLEALRATRLRLLQELPKNSEILDIGCGSGPLLLPMLEAGHRVTGLDHSQSLLEELRGEAAARGIDVDKLRLVAGDARQLALPDDSFDVVYSFATLYAVPEIERALAEVARVLRPGGVAFLEQGNARSLNAIEATRVGTGSTPSHQSPGRMRHLLRQSGLAVQSVRAFQLFPMWGGGTDRASNLLHPRLCEPLATTVDGVMLDERISSSPWLQPFAFRQLWCLQKGGTEVPAERAGALVPEAEEARNRRRRAAEHVANGEVEAALALLIDCLGDDPDDPRAALDLAALFDGDAERRCVRRWHRCLSRAASWPAEGMTRTAVPDAAPQSPRISVVLPTFDTGHLLPEAVQSVFAQTFADFELIVVDDGSRDDTWRYLSRLTDPRVQVLRQSHQQRPTALNRGFAMARGALRTWISADNVCEPTMLARLVETLDRNPQAQLAVAAFARVDARLNELGIVDQQDVSFAGFLPQNPGIAAFAYRADTARRIGDYDVELDGAEDWDYWLRLLQHGPAVRIGDVLCRHREHKRSPTIPDKVQRASEGVVAAWRTRYGGLPPLELLGGDETIWFRLGSKLLASPFTRAGLAVEALQRALQHDPNDARALVQVTIAMARHGAHAEAAQIARHFANAESQSLRQLAKALQMLADGDPRVRPEQLPLVPYDEPTLTCAV